MKREWEICFDLCLESINSGSLGISALIADEEHTVIAKGRNQLFDDDDSCNTIVNTVVSHAEINALANLPEKYRDDRNLTIFTTVEPCLMCLGALSMSCVRNVVIGSRDDYSGATRLINKDWYLIKKDFSIQFVNDEVENLFFILSTYSLLVNRKLPITHLYFKKIRKRYSKNLDRLLKLIENEDFNIAIKNRNKTRIRELVKDIDINTN